MVTFSGNRCPTVRYKDSDLILSTYIGHSTGGKVTSDVRSGPRAREIRFSGVKHGQDRHKDGLSFEDLQFFTLEFFQDRDEFLEDNAGYNFGTLLSKINQDCYRPCLEQGFRERNKCHIKAV